VCHSLRTEGINVLPLVEWSCWIYALMLVPVPSSLCHRACAIEPMIEPVPSSLCHRACAFEPVPSSLCHRACAIEPVPSIADPVADDNENDDDTKLNQMEA